MHIFDSLLDKLCTYQKMNNVTLFSEEDFASTNPKVNDTVTSVKDELKKDLTTRLITLGFIKNFHMFPESEFEENLSILYKILGLDNEPITRERFCSIVYKMQDRTKRVSDEKELTVCYSSGYGIPKIKGNRIYDIIDLMHEYNLSASDRELILFSANEMIGNSISDMDYQHELMRYQPSQSHNCETDNINKLKISDLDEKRRNNEVVERLIKNFNDSYIKNELEENAKKLSEKYYFLILGRAEETLTKLSLLRNKLLNTYMVSPTTVDSFTNYYEKYFAGFSDSYNNDEFKSIFNDYNEVMVIEETLERHSKSKLNDNMYSHGIYCKKTPDTISDAFRFSDSKNESFMIPYSSVLYVISQIDGNDFGSVCENNTKYVAALYIEIMSKIEKELCDKFLE